MMYCAGGVSGEVGDGYNMLINHVTVSGSDISAVFTENIRTRIPIAHWLRIPQSAVPAMWEDIPVIRIQIIQEDLALLECTSLKVKHLATMPEASSEWYGRILSKSVLSVRWMFRRMPMPVVWWEIFTAEIFLEILSMRM